MTNRWVAFVFAFIAIVFIFAQGASAADQKVALVIGNSNYMHSSKLPNPKNDARKIAAALERLDFEVVLGVDLTRDRFIRKLREFSKKIRNAKIGLIFYAGHGLQVDGVNYLVPVDAQLKEEEDLRDQAINLTTDIMDRIENADRAKINLVFLDACRDNPLARRLFRSITKIKRGAQVLLKKGLAKAETGINTLVAYATSPNQTALDGDKGNSPFTLGLLKHIETPNLKISDLMIRVRRSVLTETDGAQLPWESSSLVDDVFLKVGSRQKTPSTQARVEPLAELPASVISAWQKASKCQSLQDVRSLQKKFKDNVLFMTLAEKCLERLIALNVHIDSLGKEALKSWDVESIKNHMEKYPRSPYIKRLINRLNYITAYHVDAYVNFQQIRYENNPILFKNFINTYPNSNHLDEIESKLYVVEWTLKKDFSLWFVVSIWMFVIFGFGLFGASVDFFKTWKLGDSAWAYMLAILMLVLLYWFNSEKWRGLIWYLFGC